MDSATKKHPTSHAASRVKAPCEGAGDNLVHGLPTNQPGTNTVRPGIRSWQNVKLGSMRPFVNGWRSEREAVLRSHSMQGSAVRPRASTWPWHLATSWGSVMSGGFLRNFGSALQAAKFGPRFVPVAAQVPAAQALLGQLFDLRGQRRVHVPAPRQALVQVLRVKTRNGGKLGAFFWANFRHDANDSVSLVDVKRFATSGASGFDRMRL